MRRKKEDSEQTRLRILKAAQNVFAKNGVSRTTQEQIATAAGVTRGAIYWHFANKLEVFFAMREQISPIKEKGNLALLNPNISDPLVSVEQFLNNLIDSLTTDEVAHQILQILIFKCEYVDGFEVILQEQATHYEDLSTKLIQVYERAKDKNLLRADFTPRLAAIDTVAFLIGVIRMWLLDTEGKLIRNNIKDLIHAHVTSRRAVISPD